MSRLITPEGILSYPNLLRPRPLKQEEIEQGKKPKFETALVFLDGTDLTEIKKAVIEVAKAKWGEKLKGGKIKMLETQHGPFPFLVSESLRVRLPWSDAPEQLAKKGYPEGATYFNVRSTRKPKIVTLIPGPNGKPSELTDESKIRAGAIVKVSVDPFAYTNSGNTGVTLGLGNVQFIRDGDPDVIGANVGPAAEDEFSADADAVADLSDITGDDEVGGGDSLDDLIG